MAKVRKLDTFFPWGFWYGPGSAAVIIHTVLIYDHWMAWYYCNFIKHPMAEMKTVLYFKVLNPYPFWYKSNQQKTKVWLKDSDTNLKFSHAMTSARTKRNHITRLRRNDGEMIDDHADVFGVANQYFDEFFLPTTKGICTK